jgi:hypothetical protein
VPVVVLPFLFIYAFEFAVNRVLVPFLELLGYGPYYGYFYVAPGFAAGIAGYHRRRTRVDGHFPRDTSADE